MVLGVALLLIMSGIFRCAFLDDIRIIKCDGPAPKEVKENWGAMQRFFKANPDDRLKLGPAPTGEQRQRHGAGKRHEGEGSSP